MAIMSAAWLAVSAGVEGERCAQQGELEEQGEDPGGLMDIVRGWLGVEDGDDEEDVYEE